MADYATLADMYGYLGIVSGADDAQLSMAITAASSAIDRSSNRIFAPQDATATLRYFTPRTTTENQQPFLLPNMVNYWWPFWTNFVVPDRILPVDDIFLTNQLITDIVVKDHSTQTVIAVDRLFPFNAGAKGRPYEAIMFLPQTSIPDGEGAIDVTAKFGWPSIPATIKNACLLQATRYFKRKDAPFGIAGDVALGSGMRLFAQLDPDVEMMIGDFRRRWGAI